MKLDLFLYQIAYSDQLLQAIEPGYLVLDNTDNERPDWREYWPIRNFLLNETLDDTALYGFFSPKFSQKTGLSYDEVSDFISKNIPECDVFTFSTYPDLGAMCLNVFEQNEFVDTGFIEIAQKFTDTLGYVLDLKNMVMDSRTTVYSNFVVAPKEFWLEWLSVCEKMYALCEKGEGYLAESLNAETTYTGNVARKVFLMERIASLLLSLQPWKVKPYNTWTRAILTPTLANYQHEAISCDALKTAYNKVGYKEYLTAFFKLRQKVMTLSRVEVMTLPQVIDKANQLTSQGHFDAAITCYNEWLLTSTSEPHLRYAAFFNLGTLFQQIGKIDEAISAYEESLKLKPDFSGASENLRLALAVKGDDAEKKSL